MLYLVQRVCSIKSLYIGTVTIYCDSKSALQNVFENHKLGITPFLQPDADIVHTAKQMIKELPIQVKNIWVKGHSTAQKKVFTGRTQHNPR
jgi:hypothetical protein